MIVQSHGCVGPNASLWIVSCRALALFLGLFSLWTQAGLEWVADRDPQTIFSGANRTVKVIIHNRSNEPVKSDLRLRLWQLSSAVMMPVGETLAWKQLQMLPDQTVIEKATLNFPSVKKGTHFQIRWTDKEDHSLGHTDVWIYPENLLTELRTLNESKSIGLLDPDDQIKPILRRLEVEFEDLENGTLLDTFESQLFIVGPFFSTTKRMPARLSERLATRAKEGVRVVWIQPPRSGETAPVAANYLVPLGKGRIVVAQAATVVDLATSPLSQLNLIRFAEIALNPNSLQLPEQP